MNSDEESPFPLKTPDEKSLKKTLGTILYIERAKDDYYFWLYRVSCLAIMDDSLSNEQIEHALFKYEWEKLYGSNAREFVRGGIHNFEVLSFEEAQTLPWMEFKQISEINLEKRIEKFRTTNKKPVVISFNVLPFAGDFDFNTLDEYKRRIDSYFGSV